MEIIRRKTDYAIRALIHLALHPHQETTTAEIAEEQEVPLEYLHKILQRLTHGNIVNSHRGAYGGLSLARDPEDINLLDIIETVQGKINMNKCFLGKNGCPRAPKCVFKSKWLQLEQKIAEFISQVTLQDLVDQVRQGGYQEKGGEGEG
ncbi:MAG: Rrf2 family transcriptional regulator [Syntrophaceticus sp.]|jgi:Rrf2 family protein|nr:Rrf2 family transcriptional regulator [Syntrophaceticus sp.]MDD4359194.1 Rrf2 family transcriptional regulator [Syntrophaceticus sp.]MDD4782052.1 Rrf2 family transcriptional regulator [Syntrophaceticus sp.]HBG23294.1 Rrf2 family transcriptional regulator [Peptococcaceae bacterium]